MSRFATGLSLRALALLAVALGIQALARGQGPVLAASATPSNVPVLIAPGDLLDISVYDTPEMTQEVRVETGGQVNLLLIGSAHLGGLTAQQAAQWIEKQLKERGILIQPQVTVLIKEYATTAVSVTGEVNHPGAYPVLTTRSVLDVISLAGGFTPLADTRVTIKHRSGSEERVTVKLRADEADAALDENAIVYPGDLVVVPRAGVVYVLGDVGRPGGIVMQDNGKITILQALAQAGGANYTAAMNSAYLLHKSDAGGYVSSRVKVGDLVHGKRNDFEMARNDILFIPGSKLKHLGQDTESLANSVAGSAVYHIVP
jgi:polysaccharide biosynthesis/export protein